jgi:hypothetical protein
MKHSKKIVIFSLTMPKTENPFATLETTLGKFKGIRATFESLGLRVELVGFRK